jgi:hypothetical protein
MIGYLIALIGTIILAVYGWGTYFKLRRKRKSVRVIRPLSHKKESTTIINKPDKYKCDQANSGKP